VPLENPQKSSEIQRAKIDWLNATFPEPLMSVAGVVAFLGECCEHPLSAVLDGGLFGFTQRHRLFAHVNGTKVEVGALAMGGEAQRGRWLLQLTGSGCGLVTDWPSLRELLEGFQATITRLDLALDFLHGEYTVDDAMDMLADGQFTSNGRTPSRRIVGGWDEGNKEGRTLYVGKAKNGKMLRVYEKGKQKGLADSDWVRYEVQLGNRDRVIPFDAITEPDRYFAGAYPALEALIDEAALPINTTRTDGEIDLVHLAYHAKRCYGKLFHTLADGGVDVGALVEEFRIVGIPRRVKPAGVIAGLDWPQFQAGLRRYDT
jgi:phage replication initiation protein